MDPVEPSAQPPSDEIAGPKASTPRKFPSLLGGWLVLPALSAILLAFCFPFASFWWLAWVALTPWYVVLTWACGSIKRGLLSGFAFGCVLHLVGAYWMMKIGPIPWAVLAVFESASFALLGAVVVPLLFRLPMWARPVVFAALWTFFEYLRSSGSVAFPWFILAASQVPQPPLVQVVSVTGQWGLSFAVALTCGIAGEVVLALRFRDRPLAAKLAATALGGPVLLGAYGLLILSRHTPSQYGKGPKRIVAIVQGNVGKVPENGDLDEYRNESLQTYLTMTRHAVADAQAMPGATPADPAFVLWPETVVPGYMLQDPPLFRAIGGLARETKTNLLVGTMDADVTGDQHFNTVVHLDPDGRPAHKYAKVHLVPMGEFFLFRDVLGKIYDQYQVPNDDLTPGTQPGDFTIGTGPNATRIGMLICYESVFPEISRDRIRSGARLLVQATSDETFDDTPNPQQHADLAVLRAVETRRYFVRAGASGLSEVIDPAGRVLRKQASLTAGTIVERVALLDGETFFVRHGDWFVGVCAGVILAAIGYCGSRPQKGIPAASNAAAAPVAQTILP